MISVNSELAKKIIKQVLNPDQAQEDADKLNQAKELVRADYRRDICKCRINLAKTKADKFKYAIECMAYLTDDELFKIMHMGRLGKDPEIRYSQAANPTAVTRYSLAVNRTYKQSGQSDVDFINIVTFGK